MMMLQFHTSSSTDLTRLPIVYVFVEMPLLLKCVVT
jgi:hypothetical protein